MNRRTPPSVAELDPMANNVEAIARLEKSALTERTLGERISDVVTDTAGSFAFVVLHLGWFTVWVVWNTGLVPGLRPFDPFPFGILTFLVSGEGVLLAIFILVSQNRMTHQADRRAHLDLQVSMLSEQEITLMLQLQRRLLDHFDIDLGDLERQDGTVRQLMEKTDLGRLASELKERLPTEEGETE